MVLISELGEKAKMTSGLWECQHFNTPQGKVWQGDRRGNAHNLVHWTVMAYSCLQGRGLRGSCPKRIYKKGFTL